MRLASRLLTGSLVVLSACFVDLNGGGGGSPRESTSVFMTGGHGQGAAGGGEGGSGGMTNASTTTGMGGNTCGDGNVVGPESCDDGNDMDGDGCSAMCEPEMLDECMTEMSSYSVLGVGYPLILVAGDSTDATDNLRLGEDASCQSDGHNQWLGVRMLTAGTVHVTLVPTEGFGGNQENAILHVRRGCPERPYADELVCVNTNMGTQGTVSVDLFVRAGDVYLFSVDGRGNGDDGAYELGLSLISICGDGTPEGMEQCDGSAGCVGCMQTPCTGGGMLGIDTGHCFVPMAPGAQSFWAARQQCVLAGGDIVGFQSTQPAQLPTLGIEYWVGLADLVQDDNTDVFTWLDTGAQGTIDLGITIGQDRMRCSTRLATGQRDDRFCDQDYPPLCELWFGNP